MPDRPTSAGPSMQDSSMHQSTVSRTSNDGFSDLPPDVARAREERAKKAESLREELASAGEQQASVARKRMNLELLDMLKRPAKPKAQTSAKGIGLYTHTEGAMKPPRFPHERPTKGEPEFLPIGGPKAVIRNGTRSSPLDEDVAKLWNEVQSAVRKEELFCKQIELSPDNLKMRYAALDVPDSSMHSHAEKPIQRLQLQQQDAEMQDNLALQERMPRPVLTGAKQSRGCRRGDVKLHGDAKGNVIMQRAEGRRQ